jgi:hypothetical protein
MATIQKTDTNRSPLLKPIINRDYTKGMQYNSPEPKPQPAPDKPPVIPASDDVTPGPQPNFDKPPQEPHNEPHPGDETKSFTFNEDNDNPGDLKEGETGPGVSIPAGTARTFANTIGNIIQIYLPRAAYAYCKIDMENVRMNVEKGHLGFNWIEPFGEMNKSAEEGLKIPDESIKMWKAAFQHWLEYKNIALANPDTEFAIATTVLLTDLGLRAYGIKKQLEDYMIQALKDSHPERYTVKSPIVTPEPKKEETNEPERRAA